jgi:hypothetical protein
MSMNNALNILASSRFQPTPLGRFQPTPLGNKYEIFKGNGNDYNTPPILCKAHSRSFKCQDSPTLAYPSLFGFFQDVYMILPSYIRNFPQMCKSTTTPTKLKLAISTVVGPTCKPGESSV